MIFPVSTLTLLSKVVREDSLGNLEMLLMCFYLPSEYQPEHSHPHKVIWKSEKGGRAAWHLFPTKSE